MIANTEIVTERLRLRPISGSDFDAMWMIYSEPRVRDHLITKPETRDAFTVVFDSMRH